MGLARAAHRTALTSSFMTTFIAGTPASAYAPTPAPRAVRAPTNEERLASVVEHLERELSRRETAERRLAQELAAAKAETEVRDQQIADICAQWERSVTQMQTARDEDVAHVTERLRYVEEVEVPSVRAQLEDAEMVRARRVRARGGRTAHRRRRGRCQTRRRRARRRLAAAAADFQRALEERDRRLRELERRSASEAVEAERRRAFELRDAEQKWDLERQQLRDDLEHVMAGAARFVRGEVLHKHRMANLPAEVAAATSVDEDAIRRILRRRSTGKDEERKGDGGASAPETAPGTAPASTGMQPRGAEGGTANADASPRQPPQPHQPPQPRQPQPPPLRWRSRAPSPKPEPRAAPPPVPTSAHATPATERRPLYVPMESLVPPPRPRRRGESENMLFILKYSRRGGASGAQLERARAPPARTPPR